MLTIRLHTAQHPDVRELPKYLADLVKQGVLGSGPTPDLPDAMLPLCQLAVDVLLESTEDSAHPERRRRELATRFTEIVRLIEDAKPESSWALGGLVRKVRGSRSDEERRHHDQR